VSGFGFRVHSKFQTRNSKLFVGGQAILEYGILIGIVTAALVTMQTYIKRGVQAGIKVAADQLGDQRKGTEEVDLSFVWKKKGRSEITTITHASGNPTAPATRSVESKSGGARVYRTDEVTTSRGTLSETLGAERGQQ
jgi:Flp pilus assembly pilin Flp